MVAWLADSGAWDFLTHNWALFSIAFTLLALVLIPTLVFRKYVNIAIHLMDDVEPPVFPELLDPGDTSQDGQDVSFRAFDGHLLRGTIQRARSEAPPKGLVVFAHEFGTDRWSHSRYTCALRRAGYDVLAFDFRGHGLSPDESGYKPRQFPSDREMNDMLGAIGFAEDHLRQAGRKPEVGILGVSRGGGAAILASIDIPSVRAIAVDGAFSSDRILQFLIRRWASIFVKLRFTYEAPPLFYWRFVRWFILSRAEARFGCRFPSVCKALRRIDRVPILFIHGERDSFVPLEQAQILYQQAANPRYLWTVPDARHNQSVVQQPAEYGRKLVAFFDRHLAGLDPDATPDTEAMSDLAQPIEDQTPSTLPAALRSVSARQSAP